MALFFLLLPLTVIIGLLANRWINTVTYRRSTYGRLYIYYLFFLISLLINIFYHIAGGVRYESVLVYAGAFISSIIALARSQESFF